MVSLRCALHCDLRKRHDRLAILRFSYQKDSTNCKNVFHGPKWGQIRGSSQRQEVGLVPSDAINDILGDFKEKIAPRRIRLAHRLAHRFAHRVICVICLIRIYSASILNRQNTGEMRQRRKAFDRGVDRTQSSDIFSTRHHNAGCLLSLATIGFHICRMSVIGTLVTCCQQQQQARNLRSERQSWQCSQ